MDIDLLLPLGIFLIILSTPIVLFTWIDFRKSPVAHGRSGHAERMPRSVKPQTHVS